jgi:ABC-type Fe3+ transport system permease subunit
MVEISNIEKAERLSRRRARMLPILAIVYIGQQATFFAGDGLPPERPVDHVKIGAWLVLSLILLLALATKGFAFQSKEVRDLMEDENTRANRASGMTFGFVFAMVAGMVLYFLDQFEPITAREAIHIMLSLGLGAALVRFGMLERRAHHDG